MNLPINTNSGELTMSSLDLLEVINSARTDSGESVIRRNQFHQRVVDELEGEHYKTFVVENINGTTSNAYLLTRDQCVLVAMRESKAVRRSTLESIKALEQKSRLSIDSDEDRLMLIQELATKQLALITENKQIAAERDQAIKTKAQISSSREASVMGKLSAASRKVKKLEHDLGFSARHATILQVDNALGTSYSFLPLRKWCKDNSVTAETVPDKRYPKGVKAWPAGAWLECYGVDLVELFGKEGAA